ncbi:hypothetical protein HCN44_009986 [Aphidius gifuensis]|uniref:Uncharacterized protein n=1 Tax=Aphidius gifuensis TaxID=684658 RepID=A0A834XYV2_APHGI|nr:hypothetical protein HCN44_009986 [Aphidius gifuensis]
MSLNNEMPPFGRGRGRGRGRGQNIFDKKKLSECTVGIINQQYPMMMNQQNSLKHKSRSIQESNDIKRRRCDDDITVLNTSGSQINQESSSLINQMSIDNDIENSYKKEMEILNNINNVKNIMKYTGCTLCHGNHPVSNCDFLYMFKNNDEIEKLKYYQ